MEENSEREPLISEEVERVTEVNLDIQPTNPGPRSYSAGEIDPERRPLLPVPAKSSLRPQKSAESQSEDDFSIPSSYSSVPVSQYQAPKPKPKSGLKKKSAKSKQDTPRVKINIPDPETLLPVRSRGSVAAGRGVIVNRLFIILLLAGLAVVSMYYNRQFERLVDEVQIDENKIANLSTIVSSQAEVIDRFRDSVSNADVLKRLAELKADLETSENEMNVKLQRTEDNIGARLNITLNSLDETVEAAQTEIQVEVKKVKQDVDSYVRATQDQFSMENSFMVFQLAGTFTLLSCLISMWHMTAHLRKFNQPIIQRKILAILWMSPVYSITSWFSLVFPSSEGYLAIIKDFYEAYVIYQFLSFLIAVLGKGDRHKVVEALTHHADHLTPPFRPCGCCSPDPYDTPYKLAEGVLLQCQAFAMQFVFLRPLTTTVLFILNHIQYYGAGTSATDYRSPQFYLTMIQNLSVFVAFTGLLKFYHAVQEELAWCRPWPKFLCIKGVVFMTFWQGLALSILAETTELLPSGKNGEADPDVWGKQAQNFLICLEMLLFSIAHFQTFPTEEWEEGYRPRSTVDSKFGDYMALRDFLSDIKIVLSTKRPEKARKKSQRNLLAEDTESEEDDANDDHYDESGNAVEADEEDADVERGLKKSTPSRNQFRKTIEAADTNPALREATQRLLSSRFMLELDDEPKMFHEEFKRKRAPKSSEESISKRSKESKKEDSNSQKISGTVTETTGLLQASGGEIDKSSAGSSNEESLMHDSVGAFLVLKDTPQLATAASVKKTSKAKLKKDPFDEDETLENSIGALQELAEDAIINPLTNEGEDGAYDSLAVGFYTRSLGQSSLEKIVDDYGENLTRASAAAVAALKGEAEGISKNSGDVGAYERGTSYVADEDAENEDNIETGKEPEEVEIQHPSSESTDDERSDETNEDASTEMDEESETTADKVEPETEESPVVEDIACEERKSVTPEEPTTNEITDEHAPSQPIEDEVNDDDNHNTTLEENDPQEVAEQTDPILNAHDPEETAATEPEPMEIKDSTPKEDLTMYSEVEDSVPTSDVNPGVDFAESIAQEEENQASQEDSPVRDGDAPSTFQEELLGSTTPEVPFGFVMGDTAAQPKQEDLTELAMLLGGTQEEKSIGGGEDEQILRKSIFTTIADMGEQEKE